MRALQQISYSAKYGSPLPLPVQTVGAVGFPDQAQFHPLKFIAAIAQDLQIYENTFVRQMAGNTAITDTGKITASHGVIVATHFPFLNKHGAYFLKLYQHRSYVLALQNAQDVGGMYVDDSPVGYSFRNAGDLLLLGGADHRTGKPGAGWAQLRQFAQTQYPGAAERYHWAAQDCMSLDGMPYIGQYAKRTQNLYVASGFNKWGMTGSMTAAMLLCDQLLGRKNPCAAAFAPSRSWYKPQVAANVLESAVSLLTPTARRCPHLGCALHWNAAEHSWDCPCHGSRFAEDGRLLDNPANGDWKRRNTDGSE